VLSRAADNLYWMARHIERAENTARILSVQLQSEMLPHSDYSPERQWQALLELYELVILFKQKNNSYKKKEVLRFMVDDLDNSSSIVCCLKLARENARVVRGGLPTDLWETVNTTWLDANNLFSNTSWLKDPDKTFDWVKQRSHLFRGVSEATMPRSESLYFTKLGMFIERADNTARILDVKYVARPIQFALKKYQDEDLFSKSSNQSNKKKINLSNSKDYYFWASVLRSLSAFEIYRKVYSDEITPQRIAELLIQRNDMPRSLLVCISGVVKNLSRVARQNNSSSKSLRLAGKLEAELKYIIIDEPFIIDIHEFLTLFLKEVDILARTISDEFLLPLAVEKMKNTPFFSTGNNTDFL
tara:strand:+ start:2471 stop:3544 length:1074 start_codon:yes stop_codon:yes gene_type:complete